MYITKRLKAMRSSLPVIFGKRDAVSIDQAKEGQDKSLYRSYAKRKNTAALIYLYDDKKLEMTPI